MFWLWNSLANLWLCTSYIDILYSPTMYKINAHLANIIQAKLTFHSAVPLLHNILLNILNEIVLLQSFFAKCFLYSCATLMCFLSPSLNNIVFVQCVKLYNAHMFFFTMYSTVHTYILYLYLYWTLPYLCKIWIWIPLNLKSSGVFLTELGKV